MIATLLALSSFWGATTSAQVKDDASPNNCLIKIDGKIFDARPCDMNHDDGGVIMFGHLDEAASAGYWVYLIDNKDGSFEGFWNDEYGAARAHARLGILTRIDQAVGECFSGDNVLLCRDIPTDAPLYYAEAREDVQGGRILLAYVGGLEYQVTHPAWEYDAPSEVTESADFDGDGRLDTLISTTNGGNCCPDSISVVSYRGDGFFTFLDDVPLPGGWGGYELVTEQARPIIRMHDTPTGHGNVDRQRGQRDYAFVGGRMELIAERLEYSAATEVAGLALEDVRLAEGGQQSLVFDINNDGTEDDITCSYLERWDTMNCTGEISGIGGPLELQCKHLAVSPVVFGPTGSHQLLCDREVWIY